MAPALGRRGPGRGDPTSHKGASPEELAGPPRSHLPQKGRLREGGRLSPGEPAFTRRGADADAEGAAPRSLRGRTRTPRGARVAGGPRATPKGAEEGAGATGGGGRAGPGRRMPGPICWEPASRWGPGAAIRDKRRRRGDGGQRRRGRRGRGLAQSSLTLSPQELAPPLRSVSR